MSRREVARIADPLGLGPRTFAPDQELEYEDGELDGREAAQCQHQRPPVPGRNCATTSPASTNNGVATQSSPSPPGKAIHNGVAGLTRLNHVSNLVIEMASPGRGRRYQGRATRTTATATRIASFSQWRSTRNRLIAVGACAAPSGDLAAACRASGS